MKSTQWEMLRGLRVWGEELRHHHQQDFAGGPVVETAHSQCSGRGFNPQMGEILNTTWYNRNTIKHRQQIRRIPLQRGNGW